MGIKNLSFAVFLLAAFLLISPILTGCGQESTVEPSSSGASVGETIAGKITVVDSESITLALGIIQTSSGTTSDSTPSAVPDDASDCITFQENGNSQTVSVTDFTAITIKDSESVLSSDELAVGDVVEVILDSTGTNSLSIVIYSAEGDESTGKIALDGVKAIHGASATLNNANYSSTQSNQNVILVTASGSLVLSDSSVTKSGDTTSEDESNFYGLNAAVTAADSSTLTINSSNITTNAEGSNAVFSTGENTVIRIADLVINTLGNSSRGLDATYGGTIIAQNVTITTSGVHCAALATDRGGGTISVTSGTLNTSGDDSPCLYSTGTINASHVTGNADDSPCMVIEGKNSITLENSTLNGAGKNGVMLYQSTSEDAEEGTSVLTVTDSTLGTKSSGAMFYVTNTDAAVQLTNSRLNFPSGVLIEAAGNDTNNWGTPGSNGGNLTMTAKTQSLTGNVICDSISSVVLSLQNSTFSGAIDSKNQGSVSLSLDEKSTWAVTADSFLSSLANADQTLSNIQSNGFTIYYDSANSANNWLSGQTYSLTGGGFLKPLQ